MLKWFGDAHPKGYTSRFDSLRYIGDLPTLDNTQKILSALLDMRIPLTFDLEDCALIAEIIVTVVDQVPEAG